MRKVAEYTAMFILFMTISTILFTVAFVFSDSTYILAGFIVWIPMIIIADALRREIDYVWNSSNF